MTDDVRQLRARLRKTARARARAAERERQLTSDETAIMRELVEKGVTQADVGRDAGITRMAVGLRLSPKSSRKGSARTPR